MNTVYVDATVDDDMRRRLLFVGQLFVYSPTVASTAFAVFAQKMIQEAFGSLDPATAQFHLPVERYANILAELKPKFIHHPDSKRYIREILEACGCDLQKTYFDVPRLGTATSDKYLTTGIAYAFHPHRDTWYSAPMCQLNWWIPIYEIETGNSMAFHPHYWNKPIPNSSSGYNYQEWNRTSRFTAAQHIKTDTRVQPRAEEPVELDPQIRLVPQPGAIIIFSGAHLHSTVPNNTGRTRFSIDFRTIHLDDVIGLRGTRNVDSECTGTTMNDHLRGSDLAHLPREATIPYDDRPPVKASATT